MYFGEFFSRMIQKLQLERLPCSGKKGVNPELRGEGGQGSGAVVTGSLLGLHALSLCVIVYLVLRFRARLRFFPPWQQALSVFALLMNDRIILLWIISLRGDPLPSMDFWLPPVVGTLVWPWLFLLLDRYRGVMRHRSLP